MVEPWINMFENGFAYASGVVQAAVDCGDIAAASLLVRTRGKVLARCFGLAQSADTVFLVASLTKPMTVAGVMTLVEAGALSLADPVQKYLPEFRGGDRGLITLRHLVTHTSGLPDMLPENQDIRVRHGGLGDFVAATCRTPLLFTPGTQVHYQSMGILLAAEIVERVSGRRFREVLRAAIFGPMGMRHTSLGLGDRAIADTARSQVSGDEDWTWNSPYWRDLGAPWGGAHSTAPDIAAFIGAFLNPSGRGLRVETMRDMIAPQTGLLRPVFGLGWMLGEGRFASACSPDTFGHFGATGTLCWADPATQTVCVLLTTRPADGPRDGIFGPVSDAIAHAALEAGQRPLGD